MRSKLSVLTTLFLIFISAYAWGEQKFGPDVETDTSYYPTIQSYFLSPYQLSDYNFLGGGARARGMGGAFLAISDDPSAASWNPAGLSRLDKPQMLLNFGSYMHRADFTSSAEALNFKRKRDSNSISFASVVIPFQIREKELVGSLLFSKLADIYQESKYVLIMNSAVIGEDTLKNYPLDPVTEKVTGDLNSVNISLGTQVYKSLSWGAGVNIYTGKFISDADFFFPSSDLVKQVPVLDVSGKNGRRFYPHTENEYSGFNFTVGFMYDLKKLHLAGIIKTPYTLKEKNEIIYNKDFIKEGIKLTEETLPQYERSPIFDTEVFRKWDMPAMIGLGSSYQINALTLAADIEYRNYSKTEVTYKRHNVEVTTGGYITSDWWGAVDNAPPSIPSLGWRNVTQFRIGGEYLVNTKLGKIPLRVGYRNDPKPFTVQREPSEVYLRMNMQIVGNDTSYVPWLVQSNYGEKKGSPVTGNIFTLGTGIAWSQIKLDVTFELARYPDIEEETTTARIPFDVNRNLLVPMERNTYSNEVTNNHYTRIMVSFTGFF